MTAASAAVSGATATTTLDVVGVRKEYDGVCVVDDVSFGVRAGEFFALLGPSGCGKTTTLRMIAGFAEPDAGRIELAGVDVAHVAPNHRDVNTVFQTYALFPHMTVAQNVAFALEEAKRPRAEIAQRVTEALELVRLGDLAKRRPKQLSGGQQQRVALARALINRPAVLLLDEPLGALDLKLRHEMQTELKSIQRDVGISFIHVTHDQEEAMTMADRIGIMSDGRLMQVGTPQEIYENPVNRFVADFVGTTSFVSGTPKAGGDRELRPFRLATGETVLVQDGGGSADVVLALRPEVVELSDERPAQNAMECRVVDVIYEGPTVRTRVALGDGSELLALSQNSRTALAHDAGQQLWASFAPRCGRLIANDEGT